MTVSGRRTVVSPHRPSDPKRKVEKSQSHTNFRLTNESQKKVNVKGGQTDLGVQKAFTA